MVDFANVEFAENPEPRCPCVLLLDTSGSMGGPPIASLNEGLKTFATSLNGDPLAAKRVEVAVVTFDSDVQVVQDFITADQFQPPVLQADGGTDMASGILKALDLIEARKSQYKSSDIAYYRPWVFMITDGAPNPGYESAAQRIKSDEDKKRVAFFAVGVEGANMQLLEQVVTRKPLRLLNLNFNDMFVWLSTSMQRVSQSKPEDQVPLPAAGWGAV